LGKDLDLLSIGYLLTYLFSDYSLRRTEVNVFIPSDPRFREDKLFRDLKTMQLTKKIKNKT